MARPSAVADHVEQARDARVELFTRNAARCALDAAASASAGRGGAGHTARRRWREYPRCPTAAPPESRTARPRPGSGRPSARRPGAGAPAARPASAAHRSSGPAPTRQSSRNSSSRMPSSSSALPSTRMTKLREEVGQRGHIAVDPLDQLAGRAPLVKLHVQPQAVQRQIGAQGVGGLPADILANVGRGDRDTCRCASATAKKQRRRCHQRRLRAAILGCVDEVADDLRVRQLQADPAEQQRGQQRHPNRLRLEVECRAS